MKHRVLSWSWENTCLTIACEQALWGTGSGWDNPEPVPSKKAKREIMKKLMVSVNFFKNKI